ncbi:hypothetical protein ACT8ZV_08135 [Nocardioides sp. MAHUQ-72]|uniref:hypothetical protein n=1 Tax=unclassified Nocardioides TaxID=2615069 RepID=UPI00360FB035
MLISARQAASLLACAGVTGRQARRLLAAGFAGPAQITSAAHLYERAKVLELATWPWLEHGGQSAPFAMDAEIRRRGREVFIARRDVDMTAPRDLQLHGLRGGWDLSDLTRVLLSARCEQLGFVPFVATVAGFVALGAELTGVALRQVRSADLTLREPGPWFEQVRGHRLHSGPGRDFAIRRMPAFAQWTGTPSRPETG